MMAKMVVLGDKRKISGEISKRVAMILKPDLLRAIDALSERWWLMGLVGGVVLLDGEFRAVEMAMNAKTTEMVK